MYIFISIHIYTHTYYIRRICVYQDIYTHKACLYVCVCVYIYIHIHTYIYIYAYICTDILGLRLRLIFRCRSGACGIDDLQHQQGAPVREILFLTIVGCWDCHKTSNDVLLWGSYLCNLRAFSHQRSPEEPNCQAASEFYARAAHSLSPSFEHRMP